MHTSVLCDNFHITLQKHAHVFYYVYTHTAHLLCLYKGITHLLMQGTTPSLHHVTLWHSVNRNCLPETHR